MKKYLSNKKLNSQYFSDLAYILFNEFSPNDLGLSVKDYHHIINVFDEVSKEFSAQETEGMTHLELLARLQKQIDMAKSSNDTTP